MSAPVRTRSCSLTDFRSSPTNISGARSRRGQSRIAESHTVVAALAGLDRDDFSAINIAVSMVVSEESTVWAPDILKHEPWHFCRQSSRVDGIHAFRVGAGNFLAPSWTPEASHQIGHQHLPKSFCPLPTILKFSFEARWKQQSSSICLG